MRQTHMNEDIPGNKIREYIVRKLVVQSSVTPQELFSKENTFLIAPDVASQALSGRLTVTEIYRDGLKIGQRKRTTLGDNRRALKMLNKAVPEKEAFNPHIGRAERMRVNTENAMIEEKAKPERETQRIERLIATWKAEWTAEQQAKK